MNTIDDRLDSFEKYDAEDNSQWLLIEISKAEFAPRRHTGVISLDE